MQDDYTCTVDIVDSFAVSSLYDVTGFTWFNNSKGVTYSVAT